MPSISIIIATCSRSADLEQTLRSLAAVQIPDGWHVELVLVESGCQSGAESVLQSFRPARFQKSTYFFEHLRGKSRALNRALAHAGGEILLFSDDDVRFPSNWIEAMCSPIAGGVADALAGGVRLAPHLLRPWMNHTHRAWLASTADYLAPDHPSEMCGANMAVHRHVFDRIGEFDEELGPGITGGGEESLLSWQIMEAGFTITGALDVQVEHHLAPERLQYKSWINAARLKGEEDAYHLHHWIHGGMRFPRLMRYYYQTKLSLRRAFAGRRKLDTEGIAPWELSYLRDSAKLARFEVERCRERNYDLRGLRKHNPDRQTVAV